MTVVFSSFSIYFAAFDRLKLHLLFFFALLVVGEECPVLFQQRGWDEFDLWMPVMCNGTFGKCRPCGSGMDFEGSCDVEPPGDKYRDGYEIVRSRPWKMKESRQKSFISFITKL